MRGKKAKAVRHQQREIVRLIDERAPAHEIREAREERDRLRRKGEPIHAR